MKKSLPLGKARRKGKVLDTTSEYMRAQFIILNANEHAIVYVLCFLRYLHLLQENTSLALRNYLRASKRASMVRQLKLKPSG